MITRVANSSDFVLDVICPTKPDSSVECTVDNFYSRPQVPRSCQKGADCWYYAPMLGAPPRVGKLPAPEFEKARAMEKLISQFRKDLGKVEETVGMPLRLKGVNNFDVHKETISLTTPILLKFLENIGTSLQEFAKEDRKTKTPVLSKLFSQPLDELPLNEQTLVCAQIRNSTIPKLLNMTPTSWHPDNDARVLIEAIRAMGPMLVMGAYGSANHTIKPNVLPSESLEGRIVKGWPKGSFERRTHHFILAIGVKLTEGLEYVYFVDPRDAGESIYKLTYGSFRERISDIYGLRCLDPKTHTSNSHGWHYTPHPLSEKGAAVSEDSTSG